MFRKLATSSTVATALLTALFSTAAGAQCMEATGASIEGSHNPFLAGQVAGTQLGQDRAPEQAPFELVTSFVGGEVVRFVGVTGSVSHGVVPTMVGGPSGNGPDGDAGQIATRSDHLGISGLRMPVNALLGVFLPASVNAGTAPMRLDFSTPASRDFALLQPELYQVFFIGDGLRADGVTAQEFEVPLGATRLFLGTADPSNWVNNTGGFAMTLERERAEIFPYCTPKLSSDGCLPTMNYSGYPSLDGTSSFDVISDNVSPGVRGTLFYGHAAKNSPFQGGFLCTHVNIRRTPITRAPSTVSGADCSSYLAFDFNDWIQSGNDPSLTPGLIIYAQWWMRDVGSPSNTGLSDALEIHLCQ